MIVVAALPISLGVLNKLAVRMAAKKRGPDARPLPAPSLWLLAQGLLHGLCGWSLLGLSLALTIFRTRLDAAGRNYPVSTGRFVLRGIDHAQHL